MLFAQRRHPRLPSVQQQHLPLGQQPQHPHLAQPAPLPLAAAAALVS